MNRYPLWKYAVIAVALVIGILYTLPNFFPEVPAVQVSSAKAKIDTALLGTVEEALKGGEHPLSRRRARPHRHQGPPRRPRHADQGQGRAAGEARRRTTSSRSTSCPSSPQWLAAIGALPMYLGLDLRGGVHFLLQVDMKAALDKTADSYSADLRSLLRKEKIQYSGIAREGGNVVMRFRDDAERDKARVADREELPGPRVPRHATPAAASFASSRASSPRRRSASRTAPSRRTSRSCATA